MSRALALVLALSLGAVVGGCGPPSDDHTLALVNDPALAEAEKQAIESMPLFWRAWEEQRPGDDQFMVKVAFPVPNDRPEHHWIGLTAREGSKLAGIFASNPQSFAGEVGDPVTIDLDKVEDWSFRRDGKRYGMFSNRVLLKLMTPEQAADERAQLSDTPLPGPN